MPRPPRQLRPYPSGARAGDGGAGGTTKCCPASFRSTYGYGGETGSECPRPRARPRSRARARPRSRSRDKRGVNRAVASARLGGECETDGGECETESRGGETTGCRGRTAAENSKHKGVFDRVGTRTRHTKKTLFKKTAGVLRDALFQVKRIILLEELLITKAKEIIK